MGWSVLQLGIYVHPTWSLEAGLLGLFLGLHLHLRLASLNFSISLFFVLPCFLLCFCIYGFSLAQQLAAG